MTSEEYGRRGPLTTPSPTMVFPGGDAAADNSLSRVSTTDRPPPSARARHGSFSFLRRSKSREGGSIVQKSPSGNKIVRRTKSLSKEEIARRNLQMPPSLPSYHQLPSINVAETAIQPTGNYKPGASILSQYPPSTTASGVPVSRSVYNPNAFYQRHQMAERGPQGIPVPPVPDSSASSFIGGDARHESMTNRGRYSYANSVTSHGINSPRRVRRRKDPTPFNVLVVGSKNCGKTSFIEFLHQALKRPIRSRHNSPSPPATAQNRDDNPLFTSSYLDTELEGERIGLTLYDSNGLERHLIDLQQRELSYFLESKFQETFNEEQKVLRATGVRDTHIHCTFLILDPSRLDQNIASTRAKDGRGGIINSASVIGALDQEIDVDILRLLQNKTTVIPVISKADTITTAHMSYLKRIVSDSLKKIKIDPVEALNLDSDDDDGSNYESAASAGGDDISDADDDGDTIGSKDPRDSEVINNVSLPTKIAKPAGAKKSKATPKIPEKSNGTDTPESLSVTPQIAEPERMSAMSLNVNLPLLPFSVITPDMYDPGTIGRRFPWGFADPYDDQHCDFVRLMDSVFTEWRGELRIVAQERWYEDWRTTRLKSRGSTTPGVTNGHARQSGPAPGGRSVSTAAAYGGRGLGVPSQQAGSISSVGQSSSGARAVSANDIGVAVPVSNGGGSHGPGSVSNGPTGSVAGEGVAGVDGRENGFGNSPLAAPRALYRGIGTY